MGEPLCRTWRMQCGDRVNNRGFINSCNCNTFCRGFLKMWKGGDRIFAVICHLNNRFCLITLFNLCYVKRKYYCCFHSGSFRCVFGSRLYFPHSFAFLSSWRGQFLLQLKFLKKEISTAMKHFWVWLVIIHDFFNFVFPCIIV